MKFQVEQTRKRNVSLTMAHQYMSQFSTRKTDTISSVGSTVIFRVNTTDAAYLKKDLQGRVTTDDLTALPNYKAITRIGTQIVRVKTLSPPPPQTADCHDLIIERSRQRYYRPVAEVERAVRERYDRCYEPLTPGDTTDDTRTTRRRGGTGYRKIVARTLQTWRHFDWTCRCSCAGSTIARAGRSPCWPRGTGRSRWPRSLASRRRRYASESRGPSASG